MNTISEFDVEELLRLIHNANDRIDIDELLYEKYGNNVTFEGYYNIVCELMPLIVMGQSPLTKKIYQGFGKDGMFYIKQEHIE